MKKRQSSGLPKPVLIVETGKVYESRAAAAKALGRSTATVYNAIKDGWAIDGYHLVDASVHPLPTDIPEDSAEGNPESCDLTAWGGERDMLPKQLEAKDRQIENLQTSISYLLAQLEDKDARLHRAETAIDELRLLHAQQLDSMQSYYAKALTRCETETGESKTAISRPARHLTRREALRIVLFGNSGIPQDAR